MRNLTFLIPFLCFATLISAQSEEVIVDSEKYKDLKASGELVKGNYTLVSPEKKKEKVTVYPSVKSMGGGGGGGDTGCDCWIDPDDTYTLSTFGPNGTDDGSTGEIDLPFEFELYGNSYDSFWINTNGNITFEGQFITFTPDGFPVANAMLAPMWCDVDFGCADCGDLYYKVTDDAVYVNWVEVGYFSGTADKVNSFQAIFTPEGSSILAGDQNVQYCYQDIQWSTGNITGTNGFGGQGATVGANAGNNVDFIQFGRFDQPGDAYDGPFGEFDGVDWLDYQTFGFNSNSSNNDNIPPIVIGPLICDTITMCLNDVLNFEYSFLGPENDQNLTVTIDDDNFPNFESTIVQGNPASLTMSLATDLLPGSYNVEFTVTDDGVPAESITTEIIIEVIGIEVPDLDIFNEGEIVESVSYCQGQDGAVLSGSDGFDSYEWSNDVDTQSDEFDQGTYSLTAYFMGCDTEAGPVNVFEIPVFNPDVNIEDQFICAGETTELSIENSDEYLSQEWSVFLNNGEIVSADLTADTIEVVPGSYEIMVLDSNNCPGFRIVNVVEEIVQVPNTNFTPFCDEYEVNWSGAWADPETCSFQINMLDSVMDTWEGANLQVFVDGTGPLNFNIQNTASQVTDGFFAYHGQVIEYVWEPGLDDGDIDLVLFSGTSIVFDTTDDDVLTEGIIYTQVADCGFNALPGTWIVDAPAGGEGWTLESEDVFNPVDGSNTFTAPDGVVGTYELTFESAVCETDNEFSITFSTAPTVEAFDYDACGEVTIEPEYGPDNLLGDVEYNWTPNLNDGFPTAVATQTVNYEIEVSNECGESSAEGVVTITPIPTAELFDATICDDETIVLNPGNDAEGSTCLWSDGSTSETITVGSAGTYTVECTNECGTAEATANITQFFSPSVAPWAFDTLICAGTEIIINPNWSNLDSPVSWSMSYTDTMGNLVVEPLDGTFPELTFGAEDIPDDAVSSSVTINYITANSCGAASGEVLAYSDACFVAATNVFTPDGDGLQGGAFTGGVNEAWYIYGIDGIPGIKVEIYDRWGGLVYENDNYSNLIPWDGTHKNGSDLEEGVYFYVIETPNLEETINGSVTILRK